MPKLRSSVHTMRTLQPARREGADGAAGQHIVKRILRKGKAIVDESYVARTNDRNEYGRVIFKRNHPFRSSTSDLLQAALRCNCDVQFQDRAPPAADAEGAEEPTERKTRLVYGLRNPNPTQNKFLHALRMGGEPGHDLGFNSYLFFDAHSMVPDLQQG